MNKTLLVNPWIYDFAAYDFGIKPVGLLRIGEFLRSKGEEIYLIDCIDGCSRSKREYGFSKIRKEKIEKPPILKNVNRPYFRYGIPVSDFISRLNKIKHMDKIFVASGMTYWYPGVQLAIKLIKERFPDIPITLGGIYATLCNEHAKTTSGAHTVFKGDYLDEKYFFQDGFYPAYDLLVNKEVLPIQLTKGCPFHCQYCASKILSRKFTMKEPANLLKEIIYYNKNYGTKNFVFYDDALAYKSDKGLKKFLHMAIESGNKFNFHVINGLHARYVDEELALLLKRAGFHNICLSLETSDEALQKSTGAKVFTDDLIKAINFLKTAGFEKNDIGVYILIGAFWLDEEKIKKDIMFINSIGAKAILASYSPIPGTQDYDMLIKSGIIREDLDPLWHNKTIFAQLLEASYVEKNRPIRCFASMLNKS